MKPNIETFIACDAPFEEANIVLFGAPFDSTTSFRPGARFGPSAMRHESFGLETYSPYQDKDLTDCKIFDSGDLELCFGSVQQALEDIEARAQEILDHDKLPLLIGGEHSVTLGAVRAIHKRYPDLHIVHFDAHADLRQDYLGMPLSHACVLRRCHDLVGDGRIHQFCIRSGEREEFAFARAHTDFHPFTFDGLADLTAQLARNIHPDLSIHDFRMTMGPMYTNLIFDLVVPYSVTMPPVQAKDALVQALQAENPNYHAVIHIDRSYVV